MQGQVKQGGDGGNYLGDKPTSRVSKKKKPSTFNAAQKCVHVLAHADTNTHLHTHSQVHIPS